MDIVLELFNKFIPDISNDDIREYLKENKNELVEHYISIVTPYRKYLNDKYCLSSGFVFYYSCILFIMHYENWETYIDAIADYNLLYMLVDYMMDDTHTSNDKKVYYLSKFKDILDNKYKKSKDNYINTVYEVYTRLITKYPQVIEAISNLFNIQVYSIKFQKSSNRTLAEYHDINSKKGYLTLRVLGSLVNETNEDIDNIGVIMQLIDDCLDIELDMKDSIYTVATYHYTHHNNLDILYYNIAGRIFNLSARYDSFKYLYTIFLSYMPNEQYYSKSLYNKTKEYNKLKEYTPIQDKLDNYLKSLLQYKILGSKMT